jgi:single-strand DNA-binding protein
MPRFNKVLPDGQPDPRPRVARDAQGHADLPVFPGDQPAVQDGVRREREEVIYVDIEAWGKQGETIAKYCTKGRPLYVEGRLRLDQWEDKNTKEKRSRMKVVLEQFQFLGDGRGGGGSGRRCAGRGTARNRPAPRRRSATPLRPRSPGSGPAPRKRSTKTFRSKSPLVYRSGAFAGTVGGRAVVTPRQRSNLSYNTNMAYKEVLLVKPVEGLGGEGDQVKVRAGYARNYLLPRKIAVPLNRGQPQAGRGLEEAPRRARAGGAVRRAGTRKKLEKTSLAFAVKTGEGGKMFGAITARTSTTSWPRPASTSTRRRSTCTPR